MPIEIDDSLLKKANHLVSKNDALKKSVAKSMKKLKNGFFSGEMFVLQSGLSIAEMKQVADVQEKSQKYLKKWLPLEKAFRANVKSTVQQRKKELEKELSSLDREAKELLKELPELQPLLGAGPERDLKKVIKNMD